MPFDFDASKKFNQNEYGTNALPTGQAQEPNDTEFHDFSDNMDLDALGALLGTEAPFGSDQAWPSPESEQNPPSDKKKKDKKDKEKKKSGSFFATIAAKFGGSKKKEKKDDNLPPTGEDISGFDFTYKPYTEEEIAGEPTADIGMTNSLLQEASPFEEPSPLEQSSPFEIQSPLGQSSPLETQSPFDAEVMPLSDNVPPNFMEDGTEPLLDDTLEAPPTEETEQPARRRQRKKGLADKLNDLVDAISDKFGGKKKKEAAPPLYRESPPDDPNYVSDTVRLVDIDEVPQLPPEPQPALFGNRMEDNSSFMPPFHNPVERHSTQSPPFDGQMERDSTKLPLFDTEMERNPISMPPLSNQLSENFIQPPPFGSQVGENPIQPPFGGTLEGEITPSQFQIPPEEGQGAENSEPSEQNKNPENSEDAVPKEDTVQEPPADKADRGRAYDIMGAVRARLRYLGKRLPSFKPKVYTVPESTYEPTDDNIKSPSLMSDVEEYLRKRNFLGVVEMEYDEMRRYLDSVDTEVRLSREDIRTPVNAQAVRDAESELFDLINEISVQNEQQRRQIGVYAPPPAEDPYNYRGINDERLYYTDMESASFSMQPHVSFESVQKIDPDRAAKEEEYYHRLHEMEEQKKTFGEDFEDDFDDDWNAPDNPFSDTPSQRGSHYDGFEDDFDDFDDFHDIGGRNTERTRTYGDGYDGFDDDFDDELAEDFDRHFTAPRVAVRSDDRKPKRVAVRRRSD